MAKFDEYLNRIDGNIRNVVRVGTTDVPSFYASVSFILTAAEKRHFILVSSRGHTRTKALNDASFYAVQVRDAFRDNCDVLHESIPSLDLEFFVSDGSMFSVRTNGRLHAIYETSTSISDLVREYLISTKEFLDNARVC